MKTEEAHFANIWIAGDYDQAITACREFCSTTPLCVTVSKAEYVYVNGAESGVLVRLMNYPRFPSTEAVLLGRAIQLADHLKERLYQDSYSIETHEKVHWHTSRTD